VESLEYGTDGRNSYLMFRYATNLLDIIEIEPGTWTRRKVHLDTPRKHLNDATLFINSGSVPEYEFGLIVPVWLAYASSCYHKRLNIKEGRAEPLFPLGVPRAYHVTTKSDWRLSLSLPNVPVFRRDYADGKSYTEFNNSLVVHSAPKEEVRRAILSVYEVRSWTNFDNLTLPLAFEIRRYGPRRRDADTNEPDPEFVYEGQGLGFQITSGTTNFSPVILANTRVIDYRDLAATHGPIVLLYTNASGRSLGIEQLKGLPSYSMRTATGDRLMARSNARRAIIYAILIGFLIFPIMLLLEFRSIGKKTTTSTINN
jgi:hypothetical protein